MGTPSESAGKEFDRAENFSHNAGEWVRAGLFAGVVMPPVLAIKGMNAIASSKTAKSAVGVVGHVARAALEVGVAPLRYVARPHGADAKYVVNLTKHYAGKDLQAAKDGVFDIARNVKDGATNALQSLGDTLSKRRS